jgi:hypothetical protein
MDSLSEPAQTETSNAYLWEVPDKPVRIYLSHEAIDRILSDAEAGRDKEIGGLLVGTVERGERFTVRIDHAIPFEIGHAFGSYYILSSSDEDRFGVAIERRSPAVNGSEYAVGFYRTHLRDQLGLGAEDLRMFENYFADPASVALLVKPRAARSALAGFFFREQGKIRGESSYLEFPVRTLRSDGDIAPLDLPADATVPTFLTLPPKKKWWKRAFSRRKDDAPKPPKEKRQRPHQPLWVSWWTQIPLLACLLAADGLLGYFAARQVQAPPARPAAAPRDPYALSLMVVEYGNNLSLTWDRQAPAILRAERGILWINDGDESRSINLSGSVLRNQGTGVTYSRVSEHVRLRLEVFLKGGRSVSETWELRAAGGQPAPLQEMPPGEP